MRSLTKNSSQAYIILRYLADLCNLVGRERYMRSLVRLQHGPGTGFFGVNNTGSIDCAKERFRAVTDSLEQTNKCWRGIDFISETCTKISSPDFRKIHRVEHTREVSHLYRTFEEDYVLQNQNFSANDLAIFIVKNQIVCLIQQTEQRLGQKFNYALPFSKYTTKIYFHGFDVSKSSFDDLVAINETRYASLLTKLRDFDFTSLNKKSRDGLTGEGRHTLPPLEIAERFGDDEFELLTKHYRHKLEKRTNPLSAWFSATDLARYQKWLSESRAT